MQIKKKLILLLLGLIMLGVGLVYAANSYRVSTSEVTIDEHGECREVSKKSGLLDIFVPTRTSNEWTTFIGDNNGGIVANIGECPTITPINGVCDSTHYNCLNGTLRNVSDTTTQYRWYCDGINGGSDSSLCTEARSTTNPINGICSTTLNNCLQGNFLDRSDTSTQYRWYCTGINGGTDDACYKNINTTCTDTTWSPSPSTVCSGTPFTQTSNCGNTRSRTGTKTCNVSVDCDGYWSNTATCNGGYLEEIYTLTQAGENGGDTTCPADGSTRVGTTSCNSPIDCNGYWSGTSTCSQTCGGGVLQEVYTLTQAGSNGGDVSCPANGSTRWGTDTCNTQSCGTPGVCGSADGGSTLSAPSTGLCSSGTASVVTGNGTWYWTCNGTGGSTVNESCESYKGCFENISVGGGAGGNAYGYYDYYHNVAHGESGEGDESCDGGTPYETPCEPVTALWNVTCDNGNVTQTLIWCQDEDYADGSQSRDACNPLPDRPQYR